MITTRTSDANRELGVVDVENHRQAKAVEIARVVTNLRGDEALLKVNSIIDSIAQVGDIHTEVGLEIINSNINHLLEVLGIDFKHPYFTLIKTQILSILASQK